MADIMRAINGLRLERFWEVALAKNVSPQIAFSLQEAENYSASHNNF
jgi:hypothetical protein